MSNKGNKGFGYTKTGRLSGTLEPVTNSIPKVGDDEVIIKVKAMALNPVDEQLAQLTPDYMKKLNVQFNGGKAFVPGADYAGVIHSAGRNSKWKVGQEVHGMTMDISGGNGTLQQYLKISASSAISPKPSNMSWNEAAAIPLVYSTVYGALVEAGKLPFNPSTNERGTRSVLILGGSSGTGNVAIQLAKKMGLRVVTSCSGRNVEFVKGQGADEVIDYRTENVVERALMSHYAPYAVVLDCVGGTDLIPHMDHLVLDDPKAPHLGHYITIVGDKTSRDSMGGPFTYLTHPIQNVRYYRGKLHSTLPRWFPLRDWIVNRRYEVYMCSPSTEQFSTIADFYASAKKVVIDSTFSFEDAKKAYERLESARAVGKVVVEVEKTS